ncbi:hypothetical protein ACKVV7_011371 [Pyricularia oryzae]
MSVITTYCYDAYPILRWLHTIDDDDHRPDPPRDGQQHPDPRRIPKRKSSALATSALHTMPPSPPGTLPRSASPPKRRRVDEGVQVDIDGPEYRNDLAFSASFDADMTPRAVRSRDPLLSSSTNPIRAPFPYHPQVSRSRSSASKASSATTTSSRQSRTTSPAKRAIDLLTLRKPVDIKESRPRGQLLAILPDDVHGLFNTIKSIDGQVTPCIPAEVKEEVELEDGARPPSVFKPAQDDATAAVLARVEFQRLRNICRVADRLAGDKGYEFEWNACVHVPVLAQAVESTPDVLHHVVTQVAIAPAFVPPTNPDRAAGLDTIIMQKKIDLALSLNPPDGSRLKEDIRRAVLDQAQDEQTVSQTASQALRYRPAAIAIETKTVQGDDNYGLVQLGVWTAAWHVRMNKFLPEGDQRHLISLPVLLVNRNAWTLYFACDNGDCINLFPIGEIGSTRTISEAYKLLASLKAVAEWVEGPFQKWIADFFRTYSS